MIATISAILLLTVLLIVVTRRHHARISELEGECKRAHERLDYVSDRAQVSTGKIYSMENSQ